MKRHGFTVIELLIAIVILSVGAWLFFSEKSTEEAMARDESRKISINAMYYSLEESFYAQNNYYPSEINSKILRTVDPALFKDPYGTEIDDELSDFQYEATGCDTDNKCQGYTLRSDMEREAEYIKNNRKHEN